MGEATLWEHSASLYSFPSTQHPGRLKLFQNKSFKYFLNILKKILQICINLFPFKFYFIFFSGWELASIC